MPYHLFVSISPCGSLLGRHGKTVIDMCFPDSCMIFGSSLCFSVRCWNHASAALIGFSGWHLIEFCFAGHFFLISRNLTLTWCRWCNGVTGCCSTPLLCRWSKAAEMDCNLRSLEPCLFFSVFCWVGQSHRWEKRTSTVRNPIHQIIYRWQTASALSVQCLRHVASSWGVLTSIGNHLAEPQDFGFVFYEQYISSKQKRHMEWP